MFNLNTKIIRRKSKKIMVGKVQVGGGAPISVQSMTNTNTSNEISTVKQIRNLEKAGADIVRVSCPDQDSTKKLRRIIRQVKVPIIADIHFHYKRAVEAADAGSACLRINPGNIGNKNKIREVVDAAKINNCSIRIGVNAGSLEKDILLKHKKITPEAMLESAIKNINILEDNNFDNFKISVKSSNIALAIDAYKLLAETCSYPLHLGITEAGGYLPGTIKSSIGIGHLLYQGIGDTIRVSLSTDPVEEVKIGIEILKALGLKQKGVSIISCPSCARQQFNVIDTVRILEKKLAHIKNPIKVSIMGCVVNGPGEAKESIVGITGGNKNTHQIYLNGKKSHIFRGKNFINEIVNLVEKEASYINDKKIIEKN